jgi:hypothetical protein
MYNGSRIKTELAQMLQCITYKEKPASKELIQPIPLFSSEPIIAKIMQIERADAGGSNTNRSSISLYR